MSERGPTKTPKSKEPRSLDATDLHILQLLVGDGRMANRAIAQSARIAESTAHARVANLFDSGVIRGVHAEVDLSAIDRAVLAVVLVRLHQGAKSKAIKESKALAECSEVLEVFFVTGPWDLLVRVAVSDVSSLRDFVVNELHARSEISATETLVVFERFGGNPVSLLEPLEAESE